jgi:hypothetical protein
MHLPPSPSMRFTVSLIWNAKIVAICDTTAVLAWDMINMFHGHFVSPYGVGKNTIPMALQEICDYAGRRNVRGRMVRRERHSPFRPKAAWLHSGVQEMSITIPHAGTHGRVVTHEAWINAVARLAAARLAPADAAKLATLKLAYGSGLSGTYGVTYYNRWDKPDGKAPFVELSAFHQVSLAQLATTTLHELAHVLAGHGAAHGPEWKAAAARLGQRHARATGHRGAWCNIEPDLRFAILALPAPSEGAPVATLWGRGDGTGPVRAPKPCGGGRGSPRGQELWCNAHAPLGVQL